MAEEDDIFALAGEYALGTLDASERMAFMRLLSRDPLAVEALKDWQQRLAPLALALPPMEPPLHLLARIEGTITGSAVRPAVANDNRVQRWQFASVAAGLVALIAAGVALRPGQTPVVPSPQVVVQPVALTSGVAALTSAGSTPALIVTHDRRTGQLKVISVNMPDDTLHSFELWAIRGSAAPKPMGLIDPRKPATLQRMTEDEGVTLAVSREPVGGSPTGLPTGPVLYTGKLVALPKS
ncbi:anti-sigma factor domain-containing protein [Sphingomonas sp. MMS24-J13]|uniref:anti-sigma factor n=1 Tax=Sphingomonas sp. MMS24-J13 TaxID=3238686 RepID=UPI00384A6939